MYIGRLNIYPLLTFSKLASVSFSRSTSSFFALKNRHIISIRGGASLGFLQGLMTNDARLLESKSRLIFSLFLNVKGRVVCDTLIYHINHKDTEEPIFMIECDSKCKSNLLKILRFYNIRKKVKIQEEHSIQALASLKPSQDEIASANALFVGKDPRAVPGWSWRMLISSDILNQADSASINESLYKRVRYCLGLPEGAAEFKANDGLPLEANADICYGISFNKGCYVGQELTARSRFVGVIRKRISPIMFESPVDPNSVPVESPIYRISKSDSTVIGNRPVGWIRGIEDRGLDSQKPQIGLALLRMDECAKAVASGDCLWVDVSGAAAPVSAGAVIGSPVDNIVRPFAPFWWDDSIAVGIPRINNPLS